MIFCCVRTGRLSSRIWRPSSNQSASKSPRFNSPNSVPDVSSTITFLQKRFCKTVAGLEGFKRTSPPFCSSSACLLFLSMRSSGCTLVGSGGGGGGSTMVGKGTGLADRILDVCRRPRLGFRTSNARLVVANSDFLNTMFKSIRGRRNININSKAGEEDTSHKKRRRKAGPISMPLLRFGCGSGRDPSPFGVLKQGNQQRKSQHQNFPRFRPCSSSVDPSTIASQREACFLQWLHQADSCNVHSGMRHGRSSSSEALAIHHQRWRAVCEAATGLLRLRNLSATENPLQWRETSLWNLQRTWTALRWLRSSRRLCQRSH